MTRYKVNRIGFINFWLYDEEDFYFYDGKLLLRGTNGSGKTVTMQSFFPLIFDGNKSPERLDPFGSRDRKIEDYLLPEDFQGNENTGYLYMEFLNKDENKYLTIGIGLRAIKNRPCEFWGFSITDNRRIGKDFLLFKERNLRVPLSKKELQSRIGTSGEVVFTQKDYKAMVNRLLFGFKNISLYSEFINLLIQIRSPKLSNSTRPSELTKILSSVLEPLSEDDLKTVADSIEDMNKYKEHLEDLQVKQKAINNLKNVYDDYNKSILYTKGQTYLSYRTDVNTLQKKCKDKEGVLTKLTDELSKLSEEINTLKIKEVELSTRKNELDKSDLKQISNSLDEINITLKDIELSKTNKEKEYDLKDNKLKKTKQELKNKEDNLDSVIKTYNNLIKDLTSYEESIEYDDAKFYLDDLKEKNLDFKDMKSFITIVKSRVANLNELLAFSYDIYKCSEEIKDLKNKYDIDSEELSKIDKEKKGISSKMLELVDNFKESIAKTSNNNDILKFDNDNLNKIYSVIDTLQKDMFIKIKDILANQVFIIKNKLQLEISNNNITINEYSKNIEDKNKELDNISSILTSNLDDVSTKSYFDNNNITYDYFFNLISFKDNVDENIKKEVESFLLQTGILSSFVTLNYNNHLNNNIKSKCIKPGIKKNNNLTTYLKAEDTPFKDETLKILESISINNDENIMVNNKCYNFALIYGNTDSNYELRYIGKDAQTSYINSKKIELEEEIILLSKSKGLLIDKNNILSNDLTILDNEIDNYTFPKEINDYFDTLSNLDLKSIYINDTIAGYVFQIEEKNKTLADLEENFNKIRKGYYGSDDYNVIKELLDNTNTYLSILTDLNNSYHEYKTSFDFVNYYKEQVENIETDIDNIKSELEDIKFKHKSWIEKQKAILDILNSDKYKDVGKEYKIIVDTLNKTKEDIQKITEEIIGKTKDKQYLIIDLDEQKLEVSKKITLKDISYKIFKDEYDLHYVKEEEIKDNELNSFINSLKNNSSNRDIYDKFNDSLNKNAQILIDYAPKNINLHTEYLTSYKESNLDEEIKDKIKTMYDDAIRKDLSFNYLGKNVNLYSLSSAIDDSILSYQNLIDDESKKLFEDLLINNVGSSIRLKINQSEEWIEKVKNLMESMNTSSGLSFSLKWSGISALNEEEVDTKEIVDIFKKDAKLLKQEHLDKISSHFKSKIRQKEELTEENQRNYLEIIKEVLDYRKWFEFKLYFKRDGKDKKELTDREFNKMSGGEKAIAMYIPLFSSIYAKLGSAYSNAPHVIALDEAFAGVDDDNIKDSFRILDNLDIDYVLTSQQLWGDYETVKHLAISELHHPIGSSVVSIIKYKWDGTSRKKISEDKEYEL